MVQMHREIMKAPKDKFVDHINGNTLDNRKDNLRLVTHTENLRNSKLNKRNTTGYKGVRRTKSGFYARINVSGREISLGGFPTLERAARAYDTAAIIHFGKYARLNFPEV